MTWLLFDKLMVNSICILSCTGDNALLISDLILDLSLARPGLIDLLATGVDARELFASIFLGGNTGTSLNGTFGSAVTWGWISLVDFIVDREAVLN